MAPKRDSSSALDASSGEKSSSTESLQSPLGDPLVTVGFIALVLPLFLHLTGSPPSGATSPARTLDYVAICGGIMADTAGTLLFLKALMSRGASNPSKSPRRIAVAFLISGLGILHLLRGLGFIKLGY